MSMDVFANAVYGVLLEGPALEVLEAAIRKAKQALVGGDYAGSEEFDALGEGDQLDEATEWVEGNTPDAFARVRKLAGVPRDAELFYTGHEDAHVGRSETPPGTWVAGFGLLTFPAPLDTAGFTGDRPGWHTWVTGG